MAIVDNTTLKGYFETGDVPTQTQFENLIDTLAQFQNGYILDSDTWTYASATSFTIAGKDVTSRFPVGTKLKLTNASTTKYFYVISTSFSTNTTVNITGGSDFSLASGAITGNYYGYGSPLPGFPNGFSWSVTFSNITQGNGTFEEAMFAFDGTFVDFRFTFVFGSTSTISSNAGFVPPIPSAESGDIDMLVGMGYFQKPGVGAWLGGYVNAWLQSSFRFLIQNGTPTYPVAESLSSTVPFTWTTGDKLICQGRYKALV